MKALLILFTLLSSSLFADSPFNLNLIEDVEIINSGILIFPFLSPILQYTLFPFPA